MVRSLNLRHKVAFGRRELSQPLIENLPTKANPNLGFNFDSAI
jgi:hypothetical protein